MKKFKYIMTCIALLLILLFLIIKLISTKFDINFDIHVVNGYFDKNEVYLSQGKDSIAFNEYYYEIKFDKKYANRKEYKIVNNSNIELVKKYFQDYENKVDFEFSAPDILNGDYYYLQNEDSEATIGFHNYSLYFYSIKSHKLIHIKC